MPNRVLLKVCGEGGGKSKVLWLLGFGNSGMTPEIRWRAQVTDRRKPPKPNHHHLILGRSSSTLVAPGNASKEDKGAT
jgi:hypothetical protein